MRLKKKFFSFMIVLIALLSSQLQAQMTMKGGRGLMRLVSADVVTPADIYINGFFSMYLEKTASNVSLAKFYAMCLNATVGLSRNFELNLHFVPYQDDQQHIFGRMGNSELGLKYKLPFSGSRIQLGVQGFFNFPTTQVANIPFDVFSADEFGWGGKALITVNFSDATSISPFKFFTNIGYVDHSVNDTYFSSKIDQMLIGAGIKIPIRSTQIYLEYTGEIFLNNKDSVAYNENSTRLTSGVRFLGPRSLVVDVSGDIALHRVVPLPERNYFQKKYAKWRLWFGLTYRFSVYKYFDKTAKLEKQKQEEELRKLEKIKDKRKNADDEMKKMKEILKKKETIED